MWYSPQKTLSYNCGLNFVLSDRGAGKTFSTLDYGIDRFIKHKEQFVYVRRNEKELDKIKHKMFTELNHHNGLNFKVSGDEIIQSIENKKDKINKQAGYVLPLSMAHQYKSANFSRVKLIIYDEFISETDQYLTNEVEKFLSLVETIFRMRKFRVMCLANAKTYYNPYFHFFGIPPLTHTDFTNRERGIRAETFISPEYREKKAATPFAKLIEGSEYGNFILNNKAILDNYEDVIEVNFPIEGRYAFIWQGESFVISMGNGAIIVCKSENKNSLITCNLDKIFKGDCINGKQKNPALELIKKAGARGILRYGDMQSKIACRELVFGV